MKDSGQKNLWPLAIKVGVVAAHLVVIALIIWGCNGSKKKAARETENTQTSQNAQNAPAAPDAPVSAESKTAHKLRVPSANPNFGKPLDFSKVTRLAPERILPGLKEWKGTGIIVDMDTRKVLWSKDAFRPVPVASMVKMMTMLLVAEELERSAELTLDTKVPVTRSAIQALPERSGLLWLAPGEEFTVRELLLGVAVKSANDAATLLGEKIGGSVPDFVKLMNGRAAELKMKSTVFYNTCGLTDKQHGNSKSSAADMVILGERLLEYPFLMEMCSTKQSSIRDGKTVFVTTNKLIAPHYPGVDGLKTGYIRAAGSCLTFSVLRNGRRIVGCVTGFDHARDRDRFCRRLIDWAYDPASLDRPVKDAKAPARRKGAKKAAKSTKSASGKKSRSK